MKILSANFRIVILLFIFSGIQSADQTCFAQNRALANYHLAAIECGNTVNLSWLAKDSITNDFEIERSFDRASFTIIGLALDGFLMGGGCKKYAFKDNSALINTQPVLYYRVKEISINGIISYSDLTTMIRAANNSATVSLK